MAKERKIKCVIWDLDQTIWNGILSENSDVKLRDGIIHIIKALDGRGIIQSVASKNNYTDAMKKLKEFHLSEYFLYPQINWHTKSSSVEAIQEALNIGFDTLAFIDDSNFELEEVAFHQPEVLCISADFIGQLLDMDAFIPKYRTADAAQRRFLYQTDMKRTQYEKAFCGTNSAFLASLHMKLNISKMTEDDLQRAEELSVRTHQLNTTGYVFSYDELIRLKNSDSHYLWIAELVDKFGTYGKIGILLVECRDSIWQIKLLLVSCRVMSRGIGGIMLTHIMEQARRSKVRLQAEFIENGRNRMMFVTYKFMGFKEVNNEGQNYLLEHSLEDIPKIPNYVEVLTV